MSDSLLPPHQPIFLSVYLSLLVLLTPDMSFRETVWKMLILQWNGDIRNGERRYIKEANWQSAMSIYTQRSNRTSKWVLDINLVQFSLPFFADMNTLTKCILAHRQLLRCGDCATSALGLKTVYIDRFHRVWGNCLRAKTTRKCIVNCKYQPYSMSDKAVNWHPKKYIYFLRVKNDIYFSSTHCNTLDKCASVTSFSLPSAWWEIGSLN